MDLRVALRAARTALPIVAEERQRIMAVAILSCERLTAELDGRSGAPLSQESSAALERAPEALRWARGYTHHLSISARAFRRRAAPAIVRLAVQGIAHACVSDPDALLRDLLAGAIGDCKAVAAQRSSGEQRRLRASRIRPAHPTRAQSPAPAPKVMV
jgi:hypothetical protein